MIFNQYCGIPGSRRSVLGYILICTRLRREKLWWLWTVRRGKNNEKY